MQKMVLAEGVQRNVRVKTFLNVIEQLDSSICAVNVAFENCFNKSLVSKWKKDRKDIIDGVALKHKKLLKKTVVRINI